MKTKIVEIYNKFEYAIQSLASNKKRKLFFIVVFLSLAAAIVILRRSDLATNPQFYAEDGTFWYSEAYNLGAFKSLLIPKQGYFQTISRLSAVFSLNFSLAHAPLVLNTIAVIIQILPIFLLLSSRFDKIIPSYTLRIFLCFLYLLLPHSRETHANITNAQWRLSISMFLVMIAALRKDTLWKFFDYGVLIIAGLSGPLGLLLLPVFFLYNYFSKEKKPVHLAIVAVTSLIQLASVFLTFIGQRSHAPLGASFVSFFKILSGHIFIASLLGSDYYSNIRHLGLWENGFLPITFGISGLVIFLYAAHKSFLEHKLFLLFSAFIFSAALITPQVSAGKNQWDVMITGGGNRYYLIPILAWIATLLWLLFKNKNKFLKIFSGILICLMIVIGITSELKFEPFKDSGYQGQVAEFELLPSGSKYEFKIVPKGWRMLLVKK